jgi:predicted MFS family arabinose efflux permease
MTILDRPAVERAILGGVLTDLLSWRWAFFINVAVAIAVLVVAPLVLSESRPETRPSLDVPGAVTVTAALLAVVYGLLAFATETSVVFLLTLYLQKVLGYSPLAAGLSFAVPGAGTVIGGVLGPRVIGALGSRNTLVAGFLVQAAATVPLVFLGDHAWWIAVLLVTTFAGGIANLVAIVGFMVTATSGLPDEEQGLATGLATMSQQVGITMGIPIMSAIATARIHALGGETPHTVLRGVGLALTVNAAGCVATAILLAAFLRTPAREPVPA